MPPTGETVKPPCNRDDAVAVLLRLREAGHVAYFAGGCVRDTLLELEPKDWDLATDAPPPRVRELFKNTQAVGAAFGVILVRHGQSVIEVATFRTDLAYRDGRRPEGVQFATAEQDAKRRDFTINGLFLDPIENRVIDYVGGQIDLKARTLRAIGVPDERFAEDHLRLLRAVRFAARFNFGIEPATANAIIAHAHQLPRISPERIADELRRMLIPPTRSAAWRMLWSLQLLPQIFRFHAITGSGALDANRSMLMAISPDQPVPFGLTLAAALLDYQWQLANRPADILAWLTKPQIAKVVRAMRQGLKISNEESDVLEGTLGGIALMLGDPQPGIAAMKRFLATPTAGAARLLLDAMKAVGLCQSAIASRQSQLTELEKTDFAPLPLITGDDLANAGAQPGPIFKKALDAAYDAQLEGRATCREQAMAVAFEVIGRRQT